RPLRECIERRGQGGAGRSGRGAGGTEQREHRQQEARRKYSGHRHVILSAAAGRPQSSWRDDDCDAGGCQTRRLTRWTLDRQRRRRPRVIRALRRVALLLGDVLPGFEYAPLMTARVTFKRAIRVPALDDVLDP